MELDGESESDREKSFHAKDGVRMGEGRVKLIKIKLGLDKV